MAELSGLAGRRAETLERIAQRGIFAGFLASTVMGVLAMAASATYQARGFFTPAYHVAFIIDPNTMGVSLARASAGERFYFSREAFVFGLAAHVIVAGMFGAVFALVARRLHFHGTKAIVGGLVYGFTAMVVMSALVLPLAASLSGAGDPISRMGSEMGWPTFVAVHAVFGLALGTWIYVRPQDIEG
jgi:uncharacterized membrane protein YagU involved in acid resistance